MKLDDTMLMYGIYNAETLERLIKTVHKIHNTTSSHEKLFARKYNHSIYLYISHCTIPSVHPTIHPETSYFVSAGDSSSSHFRQEH